MISMIAPLTGDLDAQQAQAVLGWRRLSQYLQRHPDMGGFPLPCPI